MESGGSVLLGRYELGRLLGKGTFAKVHYARDIKSNQSVAIKMIDKEKVTKAELVEQIKREAVVMKLVQHPNIVQLRELMAGKNKIYFVMDCIKGGELFKKIANGGKLQEDIAYKYFRQLINAVDFCHSRGVYHRDLKLENLLLDENDNIKVSDFGLSALAESKRQDGLLHTTCGTPAYVAPEVISKKGYDGAKSDIWSCGVILFVLVAGYLPFHDSNLIEMYKKIERGEFRCPSWFSPELRKLVKKILDPNPETRITVEKIKRSSWFRKAAGENIVDRGRKTRENSTCMKVQEPAANNGGNKRQEQIKATNLNAFDIISFSSGFDLSGLFVEKGRKREARFTSVESPQVIISKLEGMAKQSKLKIKKHDGVVKLQSLKESRMGFLELDVEIFEITPSHHLVELKNLNGNTVEYQRFLKEEIKPALKDIVWAWQGDQEQQEIL